MRKEELVRALHNANRMISRLEKKLAWLEEENTYLREQLGLQKHHRFGKKSEADSVPEEPAESDTLQTVAFPRYEPRKPKAKGSRPWKPTGGCFWEAKIQAFTNRRRVT